MKRPAVLVETRKDGPKGLAYDRARELMARAGLELVDVIPIAELDRVRQWVHGAKDARPLIVAAGGDGTIGSVANYLVNTDTVLGILPLGTSNDVARSLEIPLDIPRAVRLLVAGKVATIDVGEFVAEGQERRTFVHAAAIGLNVRFARMATQKSMRARFGPFTYVVAALLAIRHFDPFTIELEHEGGREQFRLIHLSIVNAPVFGGALNLRVPGTHVDDRRLDLIAIEDISLQRLLVSLSRMLICRGRAPAGLRMLHFNHVRIHAQTPLDVTLDGEIAGRVPGDFRLAARALRVITPRDFTDAADDVTDRRAV